MGGAVGGCALAMDGDAPDGIDEDDVAGDRFSEASDPIINGSLVTPSSSIYVNVNRAVVGLDAVQSVRSLGTGLLVAPRIVLTASHVGMDGACNTVGQSVEFGTDSTQPEEQINVVGEIDFPSSCSLINTRGCCASGGNNVDIGLWVLEHPPAVAAPFWKPRIDVPAQEFVRRFGFGPNNGSNNTGKLWFAACTTTQPYWTAFNGTRFNSDNCTFGAFGEGGDSGGPVFDANSNMVGIHIGTASNVPSISMSLTLGYVQWIQTQINVHKSELVIGDFDGGGLQDYLHWNRYDRGNWLDINDGPWPDGGGEPGLGFTWCAQDLHVGDFNGDGRDDLLCHNAAGQKLYYRYGNPAGGFTGNITYSSSWCGNEVYAGDFNGDGFDDLLCREQGTMRKIKLNNQTGTPFAGNGSNWTENAGWCGQELYVGRFNNDNRDDILCRNPGVALYVRHATSFGTLGATYSMATGWCGQKLLVADFNNDQRDDLMCLDQVGDNVWIDYASTALFPFSGQTDWGNVNYPFCGQTAQAADVDGDGRAEVVCHDPASGIVWVDKTTTSFGGFDGVPDAKQPNIDTPLWP
jgi:FG-GAP-like repeat/Trypsin-like peptidase domain